MHEAWPMVWKAATNTSRQEYEALVRAGEEHKANFGKHGNRDTSPKQALDTLASALHTLGHDIHRSVQWLKSPQAGHIATWPLPCLDDRQLCLLRKVLLAFAARADELIKAGSLQIHAHYVQGWNHLARLLLFTADFDDWAAFRVFEGLMLEYGMAHFADTEATDQLWARIFARYDDWYGKPLGAFGRCFDAQHFFRAISGTALQTSGFTLGLPPLTALKALATVVHAGTAGAAVKLEELLTGAIARSVRLSGVHPVDLDTINSCRAERAMSSARASLAVAFASRGLDITGQLRIALRLQQRRCCRKACDAFMLRLTIQRACRLLTKNAALRVRSEEAGLNSFRFYI